MALVGAINFLLGMESAKFTAGTNRGIKDLNRFSGAARGLQSALGAIGLGIGIHQVTSFLGESIRAAEEQHKATEKLNAVLEATGHAAGFTAGELEKQASALQTLTGEADEAVTSAQAVLATFRRVQGEAFVRGTELALDMSRVLDVDLKTSILQVGKALNDPVLGMTALRRAGVSFTEDQKKTIRSMMEMNDVAGAQRVILSELADEFGGAAKKMLTDMDKLNVSLSELKESIGTGLLGLLGTPEGGGPGFLETLSILIDDIAKSGIGPDTFGNADKEVDRRFIETQRQEIIDATPQWVRDEELSNQLKEANALIDRNGLAAAKRILTFAPQTPQLDEAIKARDAAKEQAERQSQLDSLGGTSDLFTSTPKGSSVVGGPAGLQPLMWDLITEAATKAAISATMMGELDAAAIHSIDSAIDRTRPAEIGADMPELRDRQFAGAAMRGSEEAFSTIAAFQGSRGPERAEQQRERQIKALEKVEQAVRDNALEIEVAPIA